MRHVRNTLTTACAAAALLALSACAGSADPPGHSSGGAASTEQTQRPSHGEGAQSSAGKDVNPLPLPVQKYLMAPNKMRGIKTATIILVNECLRQRNIPTIEQPANGADRQSYPDPYKVGRRYGAIVKADMLTYGYHLSPAWLGGTTKAAAPKISDRQEAAMDGPAGCLAVAQGKLMGKITLDSPVARQISGRSFVESMKDPGVKAVTAKWSACMAKRGYSYTDPLQALTKADLGPPKPSAEELRTAAADYACKESTRLTSTWQKVESGIQDREIAKHRAALEKENAQRARIVAKAEQIIDRNG
ncbi:hypothetical protein ACIRU3_00030 [Streptomyces sp. NPDC101151]|uniref:hypothetical protein n=1 Tax=Streptomyces sp. NPDC101151 TaxID=3366115 RepID=UPI00381DD35E